MCPIVCSIANFEITIGNIITLTNIGLVMTKCHLTYNLPPIYKAHYSKFYDTFNDSNIMHMDICSKKYPVIYSSDIMMDCYKHGCSL